MRYNVFISYSRKDSVVAERICRALDRAGLTYFIDRKGIDGGEEFLSRIVSAINESDILLFLASRNSYNSLYSIKELNYAIHTKTAKVLPYIIDDSDLPPTLKLLLSDINWRTIKTCPISPDLINNICTILDQGTESNHNKKLFRLPSIRKWWPILLLLLFVLGGWFYFNEAHRDAGDSPQSTQESFVCDTLAVTGTEEEPAAGEIKAAATLNSPRIQEAKEENNTTSIIPTISVSAEPSIGRASDDQVVPRAEADISPIAVETADIDESYSEDLVNEGAGIEDDAEEMITRSGVMINGQQKYTKADLVPQGGSYKATVTLEEGPIEDGIFNISSTDDWCTYSIENIDPESLTLKIQYTANKTEEIRVAVVSVFLGDERASLTLMQSSIPTAVSEYRWHTKLSQLLENPSTTFGADRYLGSLKQRTVRDGYGLYLWKDGSLYAGYWKNNSRSGKGISIQPKGYVFSGLPECWIQVSDYVEDVQQGQISCYNEFGSLIYEGPISAGHPTDDYPARAPSRNKKFEYLSFESGDWYLGETLNGVMNGFGLYVNALGESWIGFFSRGKKTEGSDL